MSDRSIVPHSGAQLADHIVPEWRRMYLMWLADLSENTRRNYDTAWLNLSKYGGMIAPDKLTHEYIRAWKLALMNE